MLVSKLKGPAAPAVQALLATCPAMARRAVSWTASYLHAVAIFLQAHGAAAPEVAKALFTKDASLKTVRTAQLLSHSGFRHPEKLRPLLDRLGAQLYANAQYAVWAELMEDRRVACHVAAGRTQLTAQRLDSWAALHPDLRNPRILGSIRRKSDADAVHAIVGFICRRCPGAAPDAVRASLSATKEDVDDWVIGWFARAELPEPPFPGTARLSPLRTGGEMIEFARVFRNCLEGRIDDALAGRSAFYVWTGDEPAIVELTRLGIIGWRMDDALGVRNGRLRPATLRGIREEVAGWGCFLDDRIEDSFRHLGVAWKLL